MASAKTNVTAIMTVDKYTEKMVHSPDEVIDFFDIVTGFLRSCICAIYDYNLPRLRTSKINRFYKSKCFNIKKKARIRRNNSETITDTDFTDDLMLLFSQAKSQLHSLEQAAVGIGY